MPKNIAIFASGTGSNAQKIIDYFREREEVNIQLIVTNRPNAPVLNIAERESISSLVINRSSLYDTDQILNEFKQFQIDFIVLAGFLWLIPSYLVKAYTQKIVNIHPALLPKYGGKGMYGIKVHQAIKKANEPLSGITIHYVNEQYDEGATIFQASCKIDKSNTPEEIAEKVRLLEHKYFSTIIDLVLNKSNG